MNDKIKKASTTSSSNKNIDKNKKLNTKKEMTSKEKKAAIILIIIGWITIILGGLIQYRDYKEKEELEPKEDDNSLQININDKLKKEKCIENLCLKDLEISSENNEIFYMSGILFSKSQEPLKDKYINIIIKNKNKTLKEWYYIESIEKGQEIGMELALTNGDFLDATDYKIEYATPKEIEEYKNYIYD